MALLLLLLVIGRRCAFKNGQIRCGGMVGAHPPKPAESDSQGRSSPVVVLSNRSLRDETIRSSAFEWLAPRAGHGFAALLLALTQTFGRRGARDRDFLDPLHGSGADRCARSYLGPVEGDALVQGRAGAEIYPGLRLGGRSSPRPSVWPALGRLIMTSDWSLSAVRLTAEAAPFVALSGVAGSARWARSRCRAVGFRF